MIEKKEIIEDKVDKTYILLCGCSYSDNGSPIKNYNDWYGITLKENKFTSAEIFFKYISFPQTIKWSEFLAYDLLVNNHNDNVIIENIARGSCGNHILIAAAKKRIKELKEEGYNNIILIYQATSFVRDRLKKEQWVNLEWDENFLLDYESSLKEIKTIPEDIGMLHLNNLINFNNWLETEGIRKFLFFGWNVISGGFSDKKYSEKLEELKKIFYFIEYPTLEDELVPNKQMYGENNNGMCYVPGKEYGGINEYARIKLPIYHRYFTMTDMHPSTEAHFVWYIDIIKDEIKKFGFNLETEMPNLSLLFNFDMIKNKYCKNMNSDYHADKRNLFEKYLYDRNDGKLIKSFKELSENISRNTKQIRIL